MSLGETPARVNYDGDESFIGLDATVSDFWRFGVSDLRVNTLRGVLAEFLVAKAVGATGRRVEWDHYDVITPSGITVEVKCGAYLQAWSQPKLSAITFSGLRARKLDLELNNYAGEQDYNADVYVFAVETARTHESYDVLDLGQWEFYVLSREQVAATRCKSLGLSAVRRMAGEPVAYAALADAIAVAGAVVEQTTATVDLIDTVFMPKM